MKKNNKYLEFLKLINYFGRAYLIWFVILFFCIIITTLLGTFYPKIFGDLVDEIAQRSMNGFLKLIFIWIVIYFVNQILHFVLNMVWASLMTGFLVDIRNKLYKVILNYSSLKLSRAYVGEYIEILNGSVDEILNFIHWNVFYLIGAILNILVSIIFLLNIDKGIAFIVVLVVPIMSYISKNRLPAIQSSTDEELKRKNELASFSFDFLKNSQEIKLLNAAKGIRDRFKKRNIDLFCYQIKSENLKYIYILVNDGINVFVKILLYLYCMYLIIYYGFSIGKFVATVGYFEMCIHAFGDISKRISDIPNNITNINKVIELFNGVREEVGKEHIVISRGEIEFQNVKFSYGDEIILDDISFKIKKGKKNVIVGASGAGKTTISELINRLYEPQEGKIIIDGYDIRKCNIVQLRNQIGIVHQETIIFEGSLRYNIAFSDNSKYDVEITKILKKLNLDKLVYRLGKGLDTYMTNENVKLSGGEKQRISIARILFKNPPIIVFDEITSALDEETEQAIKLIIEDIVHEKTVILIAHKLSMISFADRILMLKNGKIVGDGRYEEMLDKCWEFKKLISEQIYENKR